MTIIRSRRTRGPRLIGLLVHPFGLTPSDRTRNGGLLFQHLITITISAASQVLAPPPLIVAHHYSQPRRVSEHHGCHCCCGGGGRRNGTHPAHPRHVRALRGNVVAPPKHGPPPRVLVLVYTTTTTTLEWCLLGERFVRGRERLKGLELLPCRQCCCCCCLIRSKIVLAAAKIIVIVIVIDHVGMQPRRLLAKGQLDFT